MTGARLARGFPFREAGTVLLLTDDPPPASAAALRIAGAFADSGMCALVVPWSAVRVESGRLQLAAGEQLDRTGLRPVPLWTQARPSVVLPLADTDLEGMATTVRRIADACPDAVLCWAPELAGRSSAVRTEVDRPVAGSPGGGVGLDPTPDGAGRPAGGGVGLQTRPVEQRLRWFGLVTSLRPTHVLLSGNTCRPDTADPDAELLDGPALDEIADAVRSRITALVADARLRSSAWRHRLVPWCTVDLTLAPSGDVRMLDVRVHCAPVDAPVTGPMAAPLVRALRARTVRDVAVRLPDPDITVPDHHVGDGTDPDAVPSIVRLLPEIGPGPCVVDTVAWPAASFDFLDPDLLLPADPLTTLGRVIGTGPGPVAPRVVEPGVGRTCLLSGAAVRNRPEFRDSSVLGIGLTPYSDRGYAMTGPHVDGLTSLLRARLRHRTADRLAAAGCRTARTTAVITLPGLGTTMPDHTLEPAALVVRAFRCVLRVKQLDPLATPFLSPQHRPLLWEFLSDARWEPSGDPGPLTFAHPRLGGTVRSQRLISEAAGDPDVGPEAARRREVVGLYAPVLVRLATRRLTTDLGRDPDLAPVRPREYVTWFAGEIGRQLAVMRRERFLHEYHQPDIGRQDQNLTYSLCESNVSLLAEFVDFDTGLFCEDTDELTLDALRLRRSDLAELRTGYARWHERDKAEARSVVRTLGNIVGRGDRALAAAAMRAFDTAYERTGP
jgi:hypothetical protein